MHIQPSVDDSPLAQVISISDLLLNFPRIFMFYTLWTEISFMDSQRKKRRQIELARTNRSCGCDVSAGKRNARTPPKTVSNYVCF